jgi:sulfatase maturation enzyme AslB (radical SAM superfamily)
MGIRPRRMGFRAVPETPNRRETGLHKETVMDQQCMACGGWNICGIGCPAARERIRKRGGPLCYGIYPDERLAQEAAIYLGGVAYQEQGHWWVRVEK